MTPGQPGTRVLIFPYDGAEAQAQAALFVQLGLPVLRAHSDACGAEIAHLPYITAPDFLDRFDRLVAEHGITHIVSPHPVVWSSLASLLADGARALTLLDPSPYQRDLAAYLPAWAWSESEAARLPTAVSAALGDDAVDALAALHVGYFAIPGQSDLAKLQSLLAVFPDCPAGDVVEIGALFGRSAFALAYLARLFRVGSVLCVDPWALAHGQDQGQSAQLVNNAVHRRDFAAVHRAFRTNRLTYGLDHLDWLRKPSLDAAADYRRGSAFSRAPGAGAIALLHIDGNHALEAVRGDIGAWAPAVRPGGWILIDDYRWAFGTGPQQAADEFMAAERARIDTAFCAGDTLYLRVAG